MLLHYFTQIATEITMDCLQTEIKFEIFKTTPEQIFGIVRKAAESTNFLNQKLDKVKYPDSWLHNTLSKQDRRLTRGEKHSLNTMILFFYDYARSDLAFDLLQAGDKFEEFRLINQEVFFEIFNDYIVKNDKPIDSTDLINLTKISNYIKSVNRIQKSIEEYNKLVDINNCYLFNDNGMYYRHFIEVSEIIKRLFAYYEKEILQCEKPRYDTYSRRSRDNSCNDCLVHKNIFILMEQMHMYLQDLYAKSDLQKFVDLYGKMERIEKIIDNGVDGINKLFEKKEDISEKK